jgi:hypothetical protein
MRTKMSPSETSTLQQNGGEIWVIEDGKDEGEIVLGKYKE